MIALCTGLALSLGCGDDDGDDDLVFDAGRDAGGPAEDAGLDAGAVTDAGFDGGAMLDAGVDAGEPDAGEPDAVQVVDCEAVTPAETINTLTADFMPDDVTVDAGEVIEFANTDVVAHTTTAGAPGAPTGQWDEDLPVGESVCLRYNVAGSYPYFCRLHPTTMQGEITVN